MCRWMVYMGEDVVLYDLLFGPKYSIIKQSLNSFEGAEPTNGDGFGVGWYGNGDVPAQYRSVEPAWHDRNLKDISKHISSTTIFCHARAASPGSTGSNVQQTNCHPFRYKKWLWMHNGAIRKFSLIKRDLILAVAPALYPFIEGSTDSEVFFFLALTFGLDKDPLEAVARAVGFIEKVGREHGVEFPVQGTVATTQGQGRLWAFRYSTEGKSRTLYYSTDKDVIDEMYPRAAIATKFGDDTRFVVSEPLGDLPGVWNLVPEATWLIVEGAVIDFGDFVPKDDYCDDFVRDVDPYELVSDVAASKDGTAVANGIQMQTYAEPIMPKD
jgi:predicted glutamine amidotransferase